MESLPTARRRRPVAMPMASAGHESESDNLSSVPEWPTLGRAEAALSTRGGLALAGVATALAVVLIALVG